MAAVNGDSNSKTAGASKGKAATNTANGKAAARGSNVSSNSNNKSAGSKKVAGSNGSAEITQESLITYAGAGKPDREAYNQEQEKIKSQIATKQAQLVSVGRGDRDGWMGGSTLTQSRVEKDGVRNTSNPLTLTTSTCSPAHPAPPSFNLQNSIKEKIQGTSGKGPAGEKRQALRNEQAELRTKTAGFKDERTAAMNQIKALQDGISKKVSGLQVARTDPVTRAFAGGPPLSLGEARSGRSNAELQKSNSLEVELETADADAGSPSPPDQGHAERKVKVQLQVGRGDR